MNQFAGFYDYEPEEVDIFKHIGLRVQGCDGGGQIKYFHS
jgi:hypothetical protein